MQHSQFVALARELSATIDRFDQIIRELHEDKATDITHRRVITNLQYTKGGLNAAIDALNERIVKEYEDTLKQANHEK